MKKLILILFLAIILTGCGENQLTADQIINGEGNKQDLDLSQQNYQADQNNSTNQTQMTEQNQPTMQTNASSTPEFVLIKTSLGDIKAKLYSQESPITVENFENYIASKSYDGTIFHRVMPGFMIQGGGFDEKGVQKETQAPIKNEAKNGVSNKRGTLAMARTTVVDSATSQFFINLVDNDFLNYKDDANYGYAVFGEVVEGMDVVDKIAQVKTTTKDGIYENWPEENVVIKSVELVN